MVVSKDEYYANTFARINTIAGDTAELWMSVFSARREFEKLSLPMSQFNQWIEDDYGIKFDIDNSGGYKLDYTIIDKEKYIFFLLKHRP
jgi:hypothetical protein